jgi:hypothetical protein
VTTPDTAQFSVSVVTDGGLDTADVQKQNTEKMNKVIEFIKGQGIEDKDIKTQRYTLEPRYDALVCVRGKVCPQPKVVGYAVTQSVVVKVRDTGKTGSILAGVVENGAQSVSEISFIVYDQVKTKNAARDEAIEQGRKQAMSVARAAGFGLGKLISVYEDNSSGDAATVSEGLGGGLADAKQTAPVPSIEPGSSEQKVRMVLTYEIR